LFAQIGKRLVRWYKAATGKSAFKVKSLKAPKTVFQAYYS
jgi:hypothetical protein